MKISARLLVSALAFHVMIGCDDSGPSPDNERPVDETVTLRFDEGGAASGLRFHHVTGGTGKKYLPETMGSGAAFLDYDGDGHLDLFFVNSGRLPDPATSTDEARAARCALFRGRGDGTFEDVSEETHANVRTYGMGCAVGDVDGDGDDDLYITSLLDDVLLINDGGRFREGTADAGLGRATWRDANGDVHPEWSTAAAFADFDRDGDLDLFVANYVAWTPALEAFTSIDGITKTFTTPDLYRGLPCRLYINDGSGHFQDRSDASNVASLEAKALGLALWDFDGNGFLDVFIANDTQPNLLLMNRGDGRFEDVAMDRGVAYDEDGRARAGMGVDIADINNDGTPWIAIGNFGREPLSLFRRAVGGAFVPEAARAGVAAATFAPLTFGLCFADIDLDARLDLIVANGHIEPEIARFVTGETHAQRLQLFHGQGAGRFSDWSQRVGDAFLEPRVARALLVGDVDEDGDLDLLVTTNGGAPSLLLNRVRETSKPHYLRVRLEGRAGNPRGLGALVTLRAKGVTQARRIQSGTSYLAQSEPVATFGISDPNSAEFVEVTWPTGKSHRVPVDSVDRTLVIAEPE